MTSPSPNQAVGTVQFDRQILTKTDSLTDLTWPFKESSLLGREHGGKFWGLQAFEPLTFSPPLQKSLGPMILPKRCFFVPHQKSPSFFLGAETVSVEDQHTFQGFSKNPWSTGACVVWNENFWNPFPVA